MFYHNNHRTYEQAREANLKHHYGISLTDYKALFKQQKGLCAICKKPETWFIARWNKTATLAVDHCHMTNQVRGLLCRRCNQVLGKIQDDTTILKAALAYLEG